MLVFLSFDGEFEADGIDLKTASQEATSIQRQTAESGIKEEPRARSSDTNADLAMAPHDK